MALLIRGAITLEATVMERWGAGTEARQAQVYGTASLGRFRRVLAAMEAQDVIVSRTFLSSRFMRQEGFIAGQRRAVNRIFVLFVGLATFMWVATGLDTWLDLRWGWDRQILWLAPGMVLFAVFVRFCAKAIFNFVGRNS
jgi:hypothetical protein